MTKKSRNKRAHSYGNISKYDKSTRSKTSFGSGTWSSDDGDERLPDVASKCSYIETLPEPEIVIPLSVYKVIRHLCETIKTEWQMLLTGEVSDDGKTVTIDGYYVTDQEVTAATVACQECLSKDELTELRAVATIHSHSNMNVFFSTTDVEHTNLGLLKYHIVVNNDDDYTAVYVSSTPCGMKSSRSAQVVIEYPETEQIEVVGIDKIKKRTYVQPYKTGGWRDDDYGYGGYGKSKQLPAVSSTRKDPLKPASDPYAYGDDIDDTDDFDEYDKSASKLAGHWMLDDDDEPEPLDSKVRKMSSSKYGDEHKYEGFNGIAY